MGFPIVPTAKGAYKLDLIKTNNEYSIFIYSTITTKTTTTTTTTKHNNNNKHNTINNNHKQKTIK